MTVSEVYDAAVIGGGILGCSTALNLARGGMRVTVLERRGLGMGASSVNGGTLAMQTKTVAMIPYHLRSLELWRTAGDWLGSGRCRKRYYGHYDEKRLNVIQIYVN